MRLQKPATKISRAVNGSAARVILNKMYTVTGSEGESSAAAVGHKFSFPWPGFFSYQNSLQCTGVCKANDFKRAYRDTRCIFSRIELRIRNFVIKMLLTLIYRNSVIKFRYRNARNIWPNATLFIVTMHVNWLSIASIFNPFERNMELSKREFSFARPIWTRIPTENCNEPMHYRFSKWPPNASCAHTLVKRE